MALPITTKPGYYNVLKTRSKNAWYSRVVWYESCGTRYGQAQPWDRPLPYDYEFALEREAERHPSGSELPDVRMEFPINFGALEALAYERAYDKLTAAIRGGQKGELGITLAQSNLTYKLYKDYLRKFVYMQKIADICDTLDRFAVFTRRAADAKDRRGRQKWRNKAARVLGVRATTDREVRRRLDGQLLRTGASSFSAEYLAYHYGWSPLFEEIYNQLQILSEGIHYPKGFYKEAGSSYYTGKSSANVLHKEHRVHVQLGAVAEVENELLYSLGVVGLANPAAVLWDAVKWSFVVDWVLAIGPRLQRQTAFLGIKFSQNYRTTYVEGVYQLYYPNQYKQTVQYARMRRRPDEGYTPPTLRVKNPIGRDWGKAFAQISLLAMFGLKPRRG